MAGNDDLVKGINDLIDKVGHRKKKRAEVPWNHDFPSPHQDNTRSRDDGRCSKQATSQAVQSTGRSSGLGPMLSQARPRSDPSSVYQPSTISECFENSGSAPSSAARTTLPSTSEHEEHDESDDDASSDMSSEGHHHPAGQQDGPGGAASATVAGGSQEHGSFLAPYLPCEFIAYADCSERFAVNEVDAWIEHIVTVHLNHNYPRRCICWFCDKITWDAALEVNDHQGRKACYESRMRHIAWHFQRGADETGMRPDFILMDHLHTAGIISDEAYNAGTQYSEDPSVTQWQRENINSVPPASRQTSRGTAQITVSERRPRGGPRRRRETRE